MSLRIIISVTSDLVTDQRVNRTASTLKEAGYKILVIGRRLADSPELAGRRYRSLRFRLWANKGAAFYAFYNIRLFWYLLWHHADILLSNDLDTLPANYLISKIKKIPLVYDSHEYFTGVPELTHRKKIQAIWKKIESAILPHIKYAFTVNASIASLYKQEYGIDFHVIRNLPETNRTINRDKTLLRRDLGLPVDQFLIILQGAGINIQRGAEEAVMAMQYLDNTLLLIIGGGDVFPVLKEMTITLGLQNKVRFESRKPPNELALYTYAADLGLSLDKDTNINYRFSLPNKLFDYLHAGIPVLASDLPEVKNIVEKYGIGRISKSHDPKTLATIIHEMLNDKEANQIWTKNIADASRELNWETERNKLLAIFNSIEK